jgi:hypothetical protein
MIAETIKLLQSNNYYGCSEVIEIAKGKNAMPKNWEQVKEKIKRSRYMIWNKTQSHD